MNKFLALYTYYKLGDVMHYVFLYLFKRNSTTFKILDTPLQKFTSFTKQNKSTPKQLFGKLFVSQFIINNKTFNLFQRKSSSDFFVAIQIFIHEEYKIAINLIKEKIKLAETVNIVDAGANIGCSTMYISSCFNSTKTTVIEPFKATFSLLKKNLKENRIEANFLNRALWSNSNRLKIDFSFRDGKEWSIKTTEDKKGNIQTYTIPDLFQKNDQSIDILKIDIEGSEFEVFLNSTKNLDALKRIKAIIIEIHDDCGSRKKLYKAIESKEFKIYELGELTLFLNKKFLINDL